jgi:hypothetical protein
MQLVRDYHSEDHVIQFLSGLNEHFFVVKTQVLLMDHLPPINKVYSLVIQEESNHKSVHNLDDSPSLINAAYKGNNKGKGIVSTPKNPPRVCTFCNRTGHTVDFCYQKHGHPSFNKGKTTVNASSSEGGEIQPSNGATGEGSSSTSNVNISQAQFSQLMALLQQVNLPPAASSSVPSSSTNHISASSMTHGPSPNESSSGIVCTNSISLHHKNDIWIIDSGANDHVCSSIQFFSSYYKIKPILVNLPIGASVTVNYAGNV